MTKGDESFFASPAGRGTLMVSALVFVSGGLGLSLNDFRPVGFKNGGKDTYDLLQNISVHVK